MFGPVEDLVLHKPEQSLELPVIKWKEQATKQKAVLCKLSGKMALLPPGIRCPELLKKTEYLFPLSFLVF